MEKEVISMLIHRAYNIPLDLTNKQKSLFIQYAGTRRFAWNWGLNKIKEKLTEYKEGKTNEFPNYAYINKLFNKIKYDEFPWIIKISKHVPEKALKDLSDSIKYYFKNKKKDNGLEFPKFKRKKSNKLTFRFSDPNFKFSRSYIRLPVIGWVRFNRKGYIPLNSKINSVTCKFIQNKWWAIIQVEEEKLIDKSTSNEIIGIDLGLKNLAVTSDGEIFENHKYKYEKKLSKLNKSFSRKVKGSSNWKKAKFKLNRLHAKISNSRNDSIHKMTSSVVKTKPGKVVLEDLNVEGMKQNHCLAKAISDAAFGEIRRQFNYKCNWNGVEFCLADRFFPSSKLCSKCGNKKTELKLNERIYECESCNNVIDRDFNAALNLKLYGTAGFAESTKSNLDLGKPVEIMASENSLRVFKSRSVKQELDIETNNF